MTEQPPKTKAEHHIEEIMQQLDPASERYRVLNSACQFKSSQVQLGRSCRQGQPRPSLPGLGVRIL
ncbi:MAG: hypothetical protein R2864_04065 [Syntrophotaleaceae bacterium]